MAARTLDINVDLGEGFGNWKMGPDADLMPLITTANVACGFHASDPTIMRETVELAKANGVALGAHPGLPDLVGFGRRRMGVTLEEVSDLVVYQVGALEKIGVLQGVPLHHVKPHGALYAMMNEDEEIGRAVLDALGRCHPDGLWYWPAPIPDHLIASAEKAGLTPVGEFYVDLSYADDGQLVLERTKGQLDVPRAVEKAKTFFHEGWMETVTGAKIHFEADSLCVHGDGPNALELIEAVRAGFSAEGVGFEAIAKA